MIQYLRKYIRYSPHPSARIARKTYRTLSFRLKRARRRKTTAKRLMSKQPIFKTQIVEDLNKLGVQHGDVLYVHSSLSRIGFVKGGANTIIDALIEAVGATGTVVLPSYSFSGSMVETVTSPKIFDPRTTPCTIGSIPETFRRRQGVFRSVHPSHSVCAYGAKAEWITKGHHRCTTTYGEGTPYWKMVQLNAKVVGLGVDIRYISFYHTFEDVTDNFPVNVYHNKGYKVPVLDENGRSAVMKIRPHDRRILILENSPRGAFIREYITRYLVSRNVLRFGLVGEADSWVISVRDLLKCLKELMEKGMTIYTAKEEFLRAHSPEQLFGLRVDRFKKHPDNPVLPKRSGKWDAYCVRDITLVISEEDNMIVKDSDGKIWAYYWGKATSGGAMKIGITKSLDDGYTWGERLDSAVIEPSGEDGSWYKTDVAQPSVIKRTSDGLLMMIARGREDGTHDTDSLGVFTSKDGLNWVDQGQKLTQNQLHYDETHGIEAMGVPCVMKRSAGDFFLIFEGRKTGGTNDWRIFAATSSTFTGTWTPYNDGYPIFEETGSGWEQTGVANPKLVEVEDSKFVLAYSGIGSNRKWRIGFATSSDLSTWKRYVGNPVIEPEGTGWEQLHTETSFLAKEESPYLRLYYHGFDSSGVPQVGLAMCRQERLLHAKE